VKAMTTFLAPEKVFDKLRGFCARRKVAPATVLFRQGEAPKEVHLVLRGDVALTPVPTEASLCRLAGPGSVLGLPANLSGKAYSLTAVAGESCEIASVPRRQFLEAIRRDAEVTLGIVQMLAEELSQMQNVGVQFRLAHLEELGSDNGGETKGTEKWRM
jgi:CRP-like cAMP-binding protein